MLLTVRSEWATDADGSEAEDLLSDMDTLSAAVDDQDAKSEKRDEVLAVSQISPYPA